MVWETWNIANPNWSLSKAFYIPSEFWEYGKAALSVVKACCGHLARHLVKTDWSCVLTHLHMLCLAELLGDPRAELCCCRLCLVYVVYPSLLHGFGQSERTSLVCSWKMCYLINVFSCPAGFFFSGTWHVVLTVSEQHETQTFPSLLGSCCFKRWRSVATVAIFLGAISLCAPWDRPSV